MKLATGATLAALMQSFAFYNVANADDATPPKPPQICFEVVPAHESQDPIIKVNRCTGETWQLAHRAALDAKGKLLPGYELTWLPLPTDKR